MNKLIFFLCFLILSPLSIANELINLSPEQLLSLQKTNNALVVDIRTIKEWETTGIIPGSKKLQSFSANGDFDAQTWVEQLNQLKSSPDQPIILVCRSGGRSGKVGTFLSKQLGMKNIYHLSNGINSWMKADLPINKDCSNMLACK